MNVDADNPLHFSEICRLCLSKEDMMTPIFEEDDKTKKDMPSLATRILMCASLQVEEGDGFPSQICTKCSGHLDNWYAFKEQCHSSDATLRQHLQTDSKIPWMYNAPSTSTEKTLHNSWDGLNASSQQTEENCASHREIGIETCTIIVNEKPIKIENELEIYKYLVGDKTARLEESPGDRMLPNECLKDEMKCLKDEMISKHPTEKKAETIPKVLDFEKRYTCSICQKKFQFPCFLKKHYKATHNRPMIFLCSECNKVFQFYKHLKEHKRQDHPVPKQYNCKWCTNTFNCSSDLRKHVQRNHPDHQPQTYLCDWCGRTFRCRASLMKHMQHIHAGKTPRDLCSICGKTFLNIKFHLPIHSEQYYECSHCGQQFKWRKSFIKHLQVHNADKPLSCSICDKAFKDKVSIHRHMRTHTGETPWTCKYCGRSFSRRWNYIQHLRLHTGAKPYVCEVCGEAFTHNVTKKKHAEQHKDT